MEGTVVSNILLQNSDHSHITIITVLISFHQVL